jgi:hypothetical protein
MDRNDPLYRLARDVARGDMAWDDYAVARLQHEMRIDYVEHMPTLDLISTVLRDEEDAVDWSLTLAEIHSLDEQVLDLDMALGQGRR